MKFSSSPKSPAMGGSVSATCHIRWKMNKCMCALNLVKKHPLQYRYLKPDPIFVCGICCRLCMSAVHSGTFVLCSPSCSTCPSSCRRTPAWASSTTNRGWPYKQLYSSRSLAKGSTHVSGGSGWYSQRRSCNYLTESSSESAFFSTCKTKNKTEKYYICRYSNKK